MSLFGYQHALNLGEEPGEHTGPYLQVLRIVAVGSAPWSALALLGVLAAVRGPRRDPIAQALTGAGLGSLLFFTLAEPRMGHFYGVMQPAVAGLAGLGAVHLLRRRDWTLALVPAALAGTWLWVRARPSVFLETATVKYNLFDLFEPLGLATAAGAAWLLILAAAWWRRRPAWAAAAVAPAAVLTAYLAWWVVPGLEAKKSIKPMWSRYLELRRGAEPIGAFGSSSLDSGVYYSDNRVVRLRSAAELSAFLAGPGGKFVVMPARALADIEAGAAPKEGRFSVVARSHPTHVLVEYAPQTNGR
jgi:hypothetical protein